MAWCACRATAQRNECRNHAVATTVSASVLWTRRRVFVCSGGPTEIKQLVPSSCLLLSLLPAHRGSDQCCWRAQDPSLDISHPYPCAVCGNTRRAIMHVMHALCSLQAEQAACSVQLLELLLSRFRHPRVTRGHCDIVAATFVAMALRERRHQNLVLGVRRLPEPASSKAKL